MTADLCFAGIFLLLVYFGWRSGMLGQALRVGAAVAVVLLTAPVSALLVHVLFDPQDALASPALEVASMVLAAILIYLSVSIAGWLIIRGLRKLSRTLSTADRLGGALIGALKASLVVYVLGVFLVMMHGPLAATDPEDSMHLRDSAVGEVVQQHNLIAPWRFPQLKQLHAALRAGALVAQSERAAHTLRQHPEASDFLRRDDVKALLSRPSLVDAAQQDHYALTLADDEVRRFLKDPHNADALGKIKWHLLERDLGSTPAQAAPQAHKE